jgi:hypothetical protein
MNEKADIKLAYQIAAEMAHIIAVGLSNNKNQKIKTIMLKRRQSP